MILLLFIAAITLVFLFIKQRFNYWKVRGVPYVKPTFPLGNLWETGTKQHLSVIMEKLYGQLKGNALFGGIYFFINPVVLALDLDFIKTILVKDFNYFHDRSVYYNEKDDPLTAHLFSMEGSKWKNMRVKLTPTFTSGKMKMMFPIVRDCAGELEHCIVRETSGGGELELKDILARYTTDVIGNCAFGLECNSLRDPNAEFRTMGREIFDLRGFRFVKFLLAQQFRTLARALGVVTLNPHVAKYFFKAVSDNIEFREKNKIERNDFMNLMIKLKNGQGLEQRSTDQQLGKLSITEVAAQAFVFFFAGFETSSSLMSFCLYELANNQDLQDKARKDVLDQINKHGSLSYEALHDMKYLENCISESLRKYPPASNIFRTATKDYNVPGTSLTIEKGTSVMIPLLAIHHDAEYYPDPLKFDPDRFNADHVSARHPFAFLPFGEGPRNCIGMRFGLMQTRIGLATLLKNFRFTLGQRMASTPKIDPSSGILVIHGGLWVKMEKISS